MYVDDEKLARVMYALDAIDSYIISKYKGTELECVYGFVFGTLLPTLDPDRLIPPPSKQYTIHDVMNEF